MNRGFKKYFKESYKASYKALRKKDNYFRYLLFLFIEFLSTIFIFFKPIIDIAKVRLIKGLKLEKRIILSKTIEAMDNPKSYWTSILATTMKVFIFIGIVLIHVIVIGVLLLFGGLVYSIIGDSDYQFISFVFMLPAVVALVLFIIVSRYLTVDTAYIVDTNPSLGASKVLYASIASLKETGKKTLFVNDLVHTLIFVGMTLVYGVVLFLTSFLPTRIEVPVQMLVLIAYLLMALFFLPLLNLSHKMVKVSLFEDIVIDKYSVNQRISGIRMIEFNKKAQMPINDRLKAVFDNEDDLEAEANLFKPIMSKEEKLNKKNERLEEARRLLEEKLSSQSNDVNLHGDNVELENDSIYLEEDKIYIEEDKIGNGGE